MGVLEKFDVTMIGATADAIDKAEDRKLFREAMTKIGLATPRSHQIKTLIGALEALEDIGLPAIIRPSFTLGGTGGGIAYNRAEFIEIVERGIDASPTSEVLIEESVLGWKEYEMEVVRDKNDNCIIVCSIENIDPMGVHTGDSITVAPALTLTDKEYQIMRDASIAVLREIGVETGGSNVQFAVNPQDGRLVVIEMNPRVSRSSALASKATGFPIAKVAAKLAVGYTLDEIENDITGGATPASFEPTIDYVVTKIPRFAFEKFPGAEPVLTTSMKSVGEAMAIGRTFAESLQKALRSLETGLTGLDEIVIPGLGEGDDKNAIRAALGTPSPDGLLKVAQAMRHGMSDAEIHTACHIDPWFLEQIRGIIDAEAEIRAKGLPATANVLRRLKAMGFSDARLGRLTGLTTEEVSSRRRALGVRPTFKRIDTCAAEFASPTAYMYSTYEQPFAGLASDEATPSDRKKVVILGGGPNRIGQGIEFDYCCCHAAFALKEVGYETIMVNCNPETVSTDYDTSDRLYFEPLTAEDVIEIIDTERKNGTLHGVIVQFGGQTPLKLAEPLEKAKVPILGTSPDAIDLAEDRDRFKQLLDRLGLRQPKSGIATSPEKARAIADEIGYPIVIRPSYVLGGRAMEIVHDGHQIDRYVVRLAADLDRPSEFAVSEKRPLLIDRYLTDAVEVDVDCLADGRDSYIAGIMEHIEEAGIHSGDSACSLPPHSLSADVIRELDRQTRALALALKVGGLMNVQYAIKDGDIYVLEVNPRASRTVPFVAKVTGVPAAKIAARIMAGETLASFKLETAELRIRRRPPYRREGGGVSVRPFRRQGRHRAWPGDEVDRRSHGHRPRLQCRLRQKPTGRRRPTAEKRHRVCLGQGCATNPAFSRRSACWLASVSGFWRPPEPSATWPAKASPRSRSTKLPKAARTSSMPSRTARSSWSSTPPRGRPLSPTAARCGGQPSCIKCRTTPLSQGPSLQRRVSRPISGVTSRYVRCKVILRPPLILQRTSASAGSRGRLLVARPDDAPVRDSNFVSMTYGD